MNSLRHRLSAAVGFLCVVAAACGGTKTDAKATPTGDGATVGAKAPDLEIQPVNGGGKVSLDSLSGKVAIIDFWATWCGPCKQSFPKFQELSKRDPSKIVVIGVSVDDEKGGIADFAKEQGATFPVGWDEGHAIANRWHVETMPTTYILDGSGTIRYMHAGYHDGEGDEIIKELAELSGGAGAASAKAGGDDKPKDDAAKPADKPADATAAAGDDTAAATDDTPPAKPPKKAGGKKGTGKKPPKKTPPPKKKPGTAAPTPTQ